MKYAILSTDNNPDYYNLLPLVCHSWRKLGYEPVVVTVGTSKEMDDTLAKFCGAKMMFMRNEYGIKDSTLAQLVRLFAYEKYAPDAEIITADADMVIARDIFTHDVSQGQIISYGYDLTGRSELPICYVKATAAKWRELMGEFIIPDKSYSDKWEDYWSVDQQLLTQRAHQYGMRKITFVDRGNQNKHGLPTSRWDRHDWAHIPDSIIDVHMKRNDWNAQYQVAEKLWPGEDHSFITKFREALNGYEVQEQSEPIVVKGEGLKLNVPINEFFDQFKSDLSVEIGRINIPDEHGFLQDIDNWSNHRPLLLLALSLTGGDVYEFGCGDGSTQYLRKYCEATGRRFRSFESNEVWALKCGAEFVKNWDDDMLYWPCSVAFVDHAPGEHRHIAVKRLAELADIIVAHDAELYGAGNYQYDKVIPLFKYKLGYNLTGGGAGCIALSNKINLEIFKGLNLGNYTFDS